MGGILITGFPLSLLVTTSPPQLLLILLPTDLTLSQPLEEPFFPTKLLPFLHNLLVLPLPLLPLSLFLPWLHDPPLLLPFPRPAPHHFPPRRLLLDPVSLPCRLGEPHLPGRLPLLVLVLNASRVSRPLLEVDRDGMMTELWHLGQAQQPVSASQCPQIQLGKAENKLALVLFVGADEGGEGPCSSLEHLPVPEGQSLDSLHHARPSRVLVGETDFVFLQGRQGDALQAQKFHVGLLCLQQESQGTPHPACPSRPSHPVDEKGRVLRGLVLDDPVHVRDIQAACRHVRAEQDPAPFGGRLCETGKHPIPLFLHHFPVEYGHATPLKPSHLPFLPIPFPLVRAQDPSEGGVLGQNPREIIHSRTRDEKHHHFLFPVPGP